MIVPFRKRENVCTPEQRLKRDEELAATRKIATRSLGAVVQLTGYVKNEFKLDLYTNYLPRMEETPVPRRIAMNCGNLDPTIFILAVLPEDVYNALDGVFSTYSAGKLKGQKLKISELLSGGYLKVHHLKSFAQIADPRCQLEFLKELQRGQFTLDQFKMEAHKVKGRQECQRQFCWQVGVATWQQATEEFPELYSCLCREVSPIAGVPNLIDPRPPFLLKIWRQPKQYVSHVHDFEI